MSRKKQTRGTCTYCGKTFAKGGVIRHLPACSQRHAILAASEGQPGKTGKLYHLRVQEARYGDYWLDLELRASTRLTQIDNYLRAIWLECCGHLSMFTPGGWTEDEIPVNRRIEQVFKPGTELTHIYDFGTSSETTIKYVSVREGKPTTPHPIALMARNSMLEANCIVCAQPASWLCIECLVEQSEWGTLCGEHAETHPHDDYGEPVPLVNSPRLGMCGYDGPADPPY